MSTMKLIKRPVHKYQEGGNSNKATVDKDGKPKGWDPFTLEEAYRLGLPMSPYEKYLRGLRDIEIDNPEYYTELTGKDAFFKHYLPEVDITASHPIHDLPDTDENKIPKEMWNPLVKFTKNYAYQHGESGRKIGLPLTLAAITGPLASGLSGAGIGSTVSSLFNSTKSALTPLLAKNLGKLGVGFAVYEGANNLINEYTPYTSIGNAINQTLNPGAPEDPYADMIYELGAFNTAGLVKNAIKPVINRGINLGLTALNNAVKPKVVSPGMQFIRALDRVPIVNENGFVELVPKNNMLANFSTDMRAASHHRYQGLYDLPSIMFIDESKLKGITPFSIKPSDTFFEAAQLRNKFKPQDITYWSYDEGLNEEARSLGFNVPETPKTLSNTRDAHRTTFTEDGKVSLLERLKKTDQERGDRDLGEKANLLRRQFEQSLYRRPSLEDYKRLETKTGLKADVTESEISKLNKIVDEYKNTNGDINKIEELYKKYGDDPVITLSDGTSFGHDDLVTLSFGTDNTVGNKLSEMLNATLDHRYDKIYYDKSSPIEANLMKSIGMGQHPKLINGRVIGAKGVGNMSLEEFNEALNNLRKRLGAKPLAKGGKLIRK